MPKAEDLMGVGLSGELSTVLGNSPATVAGAGTTQGTATTILTKNSELVPTTNQTGGILQSSALVGASYWVFNAAATAVTGKVYAPSTHYMNGSLNGSVSIAQNQGCLVWQYKKGYWASILTA